MPRPRFNKLPAEKREQIMQTAGKEFSTYGYEDASLNRILESVGMSKGAAYYYFDDKADLFGSVLSYYADEVTNLTELDPEVLTSETFWPVLMNLYSTIGPHIQAAPWVMGLFRALHGLPMHTREHEAMKAYIDQMWSWFTILVRRGQALGVVRTDLPEDLLFALITGLDGASDQWIMTHWEELSPEELKRILGIVIDMIRRLTAP
jgi:AcrR family transcriptional regulator